MTAIWTHRRRILLISVLLWLAGACGSGLRAQSAVESNGQGSVTIDASRLIEAIPLDGPWRFHGGDEARFADPNFDDSAWPLVLSGGDKLLADAHISNIPDGRDWARLHLHILNAKGPLAISIESRDYQPYDVFANGRQIGATVNFPSAMTYGAWRFALTLPQASDIELAIHVSDPDKSVIHYFPLEHIVIGQRGLLTNEIDLERYTSFEEWTLAKLINAFIFFACIPASLFLLWAQRSHYEYLWLAAFCLFLGASALGNAPLFLFLWIPTGFSVSLLFKLFNFVDPGLVISSSEFIAAVGNVRIGKGVRTIQVASFVPPVLGLFGFDARVQVWGPLLWLSVTVYLLYVAHRRGSKECRLLLFPMLLQTGMSVFATTKGLFPKQLGPLSKFHLGGVGYMIYDVTPLVFLAGIIAVVLYRFIRVSKDEEIAAAELEAARTVQRLLIPETSPMTPGFAVESVYLPARQVGGDFFLVLPTAAGSGDGSLLAVMGDVSGKGLQAAMVVSTIIGGLRMQLSRQPGEVLAHLNRMLTGHVSGFATCCAVLIEADGRMRIANAGNPAPYINGEEIATLPGLPLGLAAEMLYEETTGVLEHGRRLTFVSDGVIEATSVRKELFGFERTREISGGSAAAIAEAATVFGVGAPQADDITVLTVARA